MFSYIFINSHSQMSNPGFRGPSCFSNHYSIHPTSTYTLSMAGVCTNPAPSLHKSILCHEEEVPVSYE